MYFDGTWAVDTMILGYYSHTCDPNRCVVRGHLRVIWGHCGSRNWLVSSFVVTILFPPPPLDIVCDSQTLWFTNQYYMYHFKRFHTFYSPVVIFPHHLPLSTPACNNFIFSYFYVMWSSRMSQNCQILFLRYSQTKPIFSFVSYCLFNPSTVCIVGTNCPISVGFSPN